MYIHVHTNVDINGFCLVYIQVMLIARTHACTVAAIELAVVSMAVPTFCIGTSAQPSRGLSVTYIGTCIELIVALNLSIQKCLSTVNYHTHFESLLLYMEVAQLKHRLSTTMES